MTKEEYIKLKTKVEKVGIENADWSDYRNMDNHIRKVAIENAMKTIKSVVSDKELIRWIETYIDFGYGSVETDILLTHLKAYPDYV